jgi:CheY-like chemotaxis protein
MTNTKLNLPPLALVVEDDHTTALLCARALESMGLQVMCCQTNKNAANVVQLHGHRMRFMLIDVVLASPSFRLAQYRTEEEVDGAQLLAVLTHFCRQAVAVQMSAYSRLELTEHGYRLEAKHFLQKPFTPATLRGLVTSLLPDLRVPKNPILPSSEVTWCG